MIEIENKASNRENYQTKRKYDNKQKKFAITKTLFDMSEDIIDYDKNIKKNCNCVDTKIPKGQKHDKKCPSKTCDENLWIILTFRGRYIEYKTKFNYNRDICPEHRFNNQIMKEAQTDQDRVGIFQKIVKGKFYQDDHLY